jgi:peptidoglycan/LPS O-acetylase OafA/YrhL
MMNKDNVLTFNSRIKSNNFDSLRFIFAFIVFLVHAYVLSGAESLAVLTKIFSSEVAVKSFFVVSGFLIFMSYENTNNNKKYFLKRARRIYPAYFFVVMLCAFLGFIFSALSLDNYCSLDVLKYIVANLLFLNFLHPNLPGVFENNTLQAINGALWTLKIEVMFYLFVPFAVMAFRKFDRLGVILILYIASVLYSFTMFGMATKYGAGIYNELQRQLPGQLAFFMVGAAGYYYYSYLAKYAVWLVVLAVGAFVFKASLPWLVVEPIALAILVVYFACIFPCIGNFGKYGDFSYGIYIVHFPILQVFISYGFFKNSPLLALGVSGLLILTVAVLLWHFVEKLFLRKSSHYVAVSG